MSADEMAAKSGKNISIYSPKRFDSMNFVGAHLDQSQQGLVSPLGTM